MLWRGVSTLDTAIAGDPIGRGGAVGRRATPEECGGWRARTERKVEKDRRSRPRALVTARRMAGAGLVEGCCGGRCGGSVGRVCAVSRPSALFRLPLPFPKPSSSISPLYGLYTASLQARPLPIHTAITSIAPPRPTCCPPIRRLDLSQSAYLSLSARLLLPSHPRSSLLDPPDSLFISASPSPQATALPQSAHGEACMSITALMLSR